jgi:hypothetical protein
MPNLLEVLGLKTLPALVDQGTEGDTAGDDGEVAGAPPVVGTGSTPPTPVSANAPAPAKGPATPSPERQKYDAERAGVMKLRNELAKHPQRAHVKDQTTSPTRPPAPPTPPLPSPTGRRRWPSWRSANGVRRQTLRRRLRR